MAHTLITHEVTDFTQWKRTFDEAEELRSRSGEQHWQVFQDWDNPKRVTVLTRFQNLEQAQKFLQSEEFRAKIEEAGVIGEPEIRFLSEVG